MHLIIYLALIAAAWLAIRRDLGEAYIKAYLPALLLLPAYFRAITPGLPDPTFNEAAVLPILGLFMLRHWQDWKPSPMDAVVLAYAATVAWSEFINTSYADAQNLMFDMIGVVIGPYVVAKGLIEPGNLRVRVARMIVLCLFINAIVAIYEFRFGVNGIQRMLSPFFPGQGEGWVTTFRHGFARTSGVFGHAIVAGIMFGIAFRLQRWLELNGHWEPHFSRLPGLPLSKARIITIGIIGGAFMTVARGPWIGTFMSMIPVFIGQQKNRRRALFVALLLVVVFGVPATAMFIDYASVGRLNALTTSQETAAYRWELMQKYWDIAVAHAVFGWGKATWPKVPGMPSIDNHYLLLSLQHGVTALLLLFIMLVTMIVRTMRRAMAAPDTPAGRNDIGFTFCGIFILYVISLGTVSMGEQSTPMFFTLVGWAEGYLLASRVAPPAATGEPVASAEVATPSRFGFRVMS